MAGFAYPVEARGPEGPVRAVLIPSSSWAEAFRARYGIDPRSARFAQQVRRADRAMRYDGLSQDEAMARAAAGELP